MNDTFLSDNGGNRVPPADSPNPHATPAGQRLQADQWETGKSATVVAGATYAFTAMRGGGFFFGLAAVSTVANIGWACPLRGTVIIVIPEGNTTLYYSAESNNGNGYLRRLSTL